MIDHPKTVLRHAGRKMARQMAKEIDRDLVEWVVGGCVGLPGDAGRMNPSAPAVTSTPRRLGSSVAGDKGSGGMMGRPDQNGRQRASNGLRDGARKTPPGEGRG